MPPFVSSLAEDFRPHGYEVNEVLNLARRAGVGVHRLRASAAKADEEFDPFPPSRFSHVFIAANAYLWTATDADVQAYLDSHGVKADDIATRRPDLYHTLPLTVTTHTMREAQRLGCALRQPDRVIVQQRAAGAAKAR